MKGENRDDDLAVHTAVASGRDTDADALLMDEREAMTIAGRIGVGVAIAIACGLVVYMVITIAKYFTALMR